jgi:AraC-like DNA-binding protein
VSEAGASLLSDLPPGVLRGPARGHFQLDHRAPGLSVADIVDSYWIVEWSVPPGEERFQDVVTRPRVHLSVERDRSTVTGVVTRCFRRILVGSGRVVGVAFRPAGFAALRSEPMSSLTDQALPAPSVLGADSHDDFDRIGAAPTVDEAVALMERFLERRRGPLPAGAGLVDDAVEHIAGDTGVTRVDQVAVHFGVSSRTLQRRFERYLGVGPKWVIQRRRIHEALDEIERGRDLDWSILAVELGFADQAHFVNAFTDLVGQPPSRYERKPVLPPAESSTPPTGGARSRGPREGQNGTGWPSR